MDKRLPYPFSVAFDGGRSIDYKCEGGKDHEFVEKLGYTPKMAQDCTYYAPGLHGFSLSSYGDWGTFYPKDADEKSTEIFFEMYEKGIIRLWRFDTYVKVYLPLTNDNLIFSYCYEDGKGWRRYDKEAGKCVECDDIFALAGKKPKDLENK